MNRTCRLTTAVAVLSLAASALVAGCGAATGGRGGAGGPGQGDQGAQGGGEGGGGGDAAGGGDSDGGADGGGGGAPGGAGGAETPDGGEGVGEGEGEGHAGGGDAGGGGDSAVEADPADVDDNWGRQLIISDLKIGGNPFDLDEDGRGDNALGLAALMANGELDKGLTSGDLTLLIDLRAENAVDNPPFPVHMYSGEDTDEDPTNNYSGEASIQIDIRSFDASGAPRISFDGATIEGGLLSARTDAFVLAFPVGKEEEESVFSATLHLVRMEAEVDGDFGGLVNGRLGGAAREDEIRVALQTFDIPENLKGMIDGFLANPDIDTDDDGLKDAFSIALTFEAVGCEFAPGFANVE